MTTPAIPPTGGRSPLGDSGKSSDGKAEVTGSSSGRSYKPAAHSGAKGKRPRSPVTPPESRKRSFAPKTDAGAHIEHKKSAMAALNARSGLSEADRKAYEQKIEENPELWERRLKTSNENGPVSSEGAIAREVSHAKAGEAHAKARETRELRKHNALMEKTDELLEFLENEKQEQVETKPIIDMVKNLRSEIQEMKHESFLIRALWVKEYADTGEVPTWAIEYTQTGRLPQWVEDYLAKKNP